MNIKRYLMASVTLFLFIYVYEFFVHGVLFASLYAQTPHLWREYQQMMSYVPFNMAIMVLLAIWITFIFTRLFTDGGFKNGIAFGFYIGVLSGIQSAGAYYYLPIPFTLAIAWFIANVVECLIGGMLIGCIYRR